MTTNEEMTINKVYKIDYLTKSITIISHRLVRKNNALAVVSQLVKVHIYRPVKQENCIFPTIPSSWQAVIHAYNDSISKTS